MITIRFFFVFMESSIDPRLVTEIDTIKFFFNVCKTKREALLRLIG